MMRKHSVLIIVFISSKCYSALKVSRASTQGTPMQECVHNYADQLNSVRAGLGDYVRHHPLKSNVMSDRELIIAPGEGTTGTRSLARALSFLGMKSQHFIDDEEGQGLSAGPEAKSWIANLLHNRVNEDASECREFYRTFDYTTVPHDVDALLDSPMSNYVLDMLLTFPKAKVILTTRPSEAWAERRVYWSEREHEPVEPPIQERCVSELMPTDPFNRFELIKLLESNQDLIRCIVPKQQFMEINLWTDPTSRINSLMFELSNFTGRKILQVEAYPYMS